MSLPRSRAGSIAIESAIAVSGFVLVSVLLLYGVLSVIAGLRVDSAMERTGRVLSLGSVAADLVGADRLEQSLCEAAGIEDWPFGTTLLEDVVVSGSGATLLPTLFEACLPTAGAPAATVDRLFAGKGARRWSVSCESGLSDGWMRVTVSYSLRTPFGAIRQRRTQAFALWNDGDGTRDARETSNVWELGNLERGRAVRVRFGGNLPLGYPVIASYRNGTATAIHSMDLSPYGWKDEVGAREELAGWIEALAGFDGTPAPWGADAIDMRPGSVAARRLLLVVPVNTDDGLSAGLLRDAGKDAVLRGVDLTVVRYQERLDPVAVDSRLGYHSIE